MFSMAEVRSLLAHVDGIHPSSQLLQPPSFNDAPIDHLSIHFTGRETELARIGEILNTVHGSSPTRCAFYGMPGLGKTQLALQYAKSSFDRQSYSVIFWISAATIEKLNQGFANILHLVGHPDRHHPEQIVRLKAARRWLEEAEIPVKWVLIFDNASGGAMDFLRDNLPRRNSQGHILFTTRTRAIAEGVTSTAGQQHEFFELRPLNMGNAVRLLSNEAGIDTNSGATSLTSACTDLVKCVGYLPLAISQAGSFAKNTHQNLGNLLALYQSEQKYEVRFQPLHSDCLGLLMLCLDR
jgi:hypothetical protein